MCMQTTIKLSDNSIYLSTIYSFIFITYKKVEIKPAELREHKYSESRLHRVSKLASCIPVSSSPCSTIRA